MYVFDIHHYFDNVPRNLIHKAEELESYLRSFCSFQELAGNQKDWFWQSAIYPKFVVLKNWWEDDNELKVGEQHPNYRINLLFL